jgi:hypothetical protein
MGKTLKNTPEEEQGCEEVLAYLRLDLGYDFSWRYSTIFSQ